MMIRRLIFFVFFCAFFPVAFAQNTPGLSDVSFNKTGTTLLDFKQNSSQDFVTTTLLQPDGKLLVAGYDSLTSQREGFIIRVLPDGKLDKTFGTNGRVKLEELIEDYTYSRFTPKALALQSDGAIVMVGHYADYYGYQAPTVINLDSKGNLKKAFNGSGYRIFSGFGYGATLNSVQVHKATDNIIALGQTDNLPTYTSSMLMVAVNKAGNAFTYEGSSYSTFAIGGMSSNITCSAQFHADSLYLGVNQYGNDDWTTMGITSMSMVTGNLSTSFSVENVLLLPTSYGDQSYCSSMTLDNNKNILLAGHATNGSQLYCLVHKLSGVTKSTDNVFGNSGEMGFQFSASLEQKLQSIALDQNNNILLGGYSDQAGLPVWSFTRMNSMGQLDSGFGIKTYNSLTSYTGVASVQCNSSNEYLLCGSLTTIGSGISDGLIKKINPGGNPITTFGNNSELTLWVQDYRSYGNDLAIRSDGKLWICGSIPSDYSNEDQSAIALINADGTPDETFGGKNGALPGVYILPAQIGTTSLQGLYINAIEVLSNGKILVAGSYMYNETTTPIVLRLGVSGDTLKLDNTFGSTGEGFAQYIDPGNESHEIQGMIMGAGGNIVLYGFLGSYSYPGVMTFSASGTFISKSTTTYLADGGGDFGRTMQAGVLSDNSIALTATVSVGEQSDILYLRTSADGSAVLKDTIYDLGSYDDYGYALAVGSQNIYIGGSTQGKFCILAIKPDGSIDTTFGTSGKAVVSKDYNDMLGGLYMEGQKIVATGLSNNDGYWTQSILRFTAKGKLDDTFAGKGYRAVNQGYAPNAVVYNNRLYTVGFDRKPDGAEKLHVEISKYYLGSGPVIKTTQLNIPNLVKTYGDEPFSMRAVTNSPAPITYTINNSYAPCATVDDKGVFTITCATNSEDDIQVVAYQPAISGYSEATAYATIRVNKAIPKVVFPPQGGVVGDTITLKYVTNSDGGIYIYQVDGYDVFTTGNLFGQYVVLQEGEAQIELTLYEGDNFEGAIVRTTIYGYTAPVKPEAGDDNAELVFGQASSISFNVLENDAAYTGVLEGASIDLDQSQPGVQHVYVSPALGLFESDSNGVVTYTPFSGFIGSGTIAYTVKDSKGLISNVGTIRVAVVMEGEKPALKATELFTPNNDGLNDAFVIGFVDLEKSNVLRVFDRNGQEVYAVNDYKNDWTGVLSNGGTAENGIYYFLFVEGNGGDQRELKGAVELRR